MVTYWILRNVILEIFISMFGGRDSKIIPDNKLFLENLYTHAHGHHILKERKLE
jgi:hypothetical protein